MDLDAGLRLAVVASPRSGNTWLRELLTRLLDLEPLAFHTPEEVPWGALPERCALQLHWPHGDDVAAPLHGAGFRVVVLARHPLDVLVSVLNFARRAEDTGSWLGGLGGDEQAIRGLGPLDQAFLDYATGPRAAALLGVTPSWWGRPGTVGLRYEDLVSDTLGELRRLVGALDVTPRRSVEETVGANTLTALRARHAGRGFHFWQASPGLWRAFLPAEVAGLIAEANGAVLGALGYDADPDPKLTAHQADVRWLGLQVDGLTRELLDANARLTDITAALALCGQAADEARDRLARLEARRRLLSRRPR